MTRDEKIAEAQRLRGEGLLLREIASTFGVSVPTIMRWTDPEYAERDRAESRARKQRYRGTCIDCGASTAHKSNRANPSERCEPCYRTWVHENRRWTPETVIAAIQLFATRYGRPPAATDFSPAQARVRAHPWRAERYETDGDYPNQATVHNECGSWANAVEAAGFPRPGHGYEHLPADVGHGGGAHLEAERSAA